MPAYLSRREVALRADEIRGEMERLMANRRLIRRPGSKQWSFLRHCCEALLSSKGGDFGYTLGQARQYRFEVDGRLRRYYLTPRSSVRLLFRVMHLKHAVSFKFVDDTYPSVNGYVLLVAEDTKAGRQASEGTPETREYLERVVAEAIDAEWAVYTKLPEIDLTPLDRWFVRDGPAYRRIRQLAERESERRWTLTSPNDNPSTKRLLDVRVIKLSSQEAWVRTKEYWHLRWWSLDGERYEVRYRETNTQRYILVKSGNAWLVEHNIYPQPRTIAPHRKDIVVG